MNEDRKLKSENERMACVRRNKRRDMMRRLSELDAAYEAAFPNSKRVKRPFRVKTDGIASEIYRRYR